MTESFRVILYNKPLRGQTLARCVEEIVSVLAIVLSGCSQGAGDTAVPNLEQQTRPSLQ